MVSERIADYLDERGIKQSKVAEEIGISKQSMNRKLRHGTTLSVEEYMKICDFLKVPYEKFADRAGK